MVFNWIRTIDLIYQKVTEMAQTVSELTAELIGIKNNVVEGTTELMDKIATLEAALTGGDAPLPEEAQIALDDLKAAAETLASIVPNEAPPPVE